MIRSVNDKNIEKRIIHVSGKRQITIPLKYHQALGLADQVVCSLENGALIIRPLTHDGHEFSVEILKDLVSQGLSGDELVNKFTEYSHQLKKAVQTMIKEADDIAAGHCYSASMDEVFGDNSDV